ncbi:MAG: hypothetical protein IPM71_10140 [Bacteroidota bacterium]|nr:MAG: hypothetical protein IPM71_10140 [Bacteroidota bacterium]
MLGKKSSKVEFVASSVEQNEVKSLSLKNMLDGSLLTGKTLVSQLPFILFLVMLAIFYIGNHYHAERMYRKLLKEREEIKNLRAEQLTTAAELMNLSKASNVEDMVQERGLGLKQPTRPPYKIEAD